MRIATLLAGVAALALVPAAQAAPKAAPKQPAPPAAAPAPPPGFFPCRTEAEICYVGIVTGKSTVMVQFTNAPQSDGIDEKPQNVFSDDAGSAQLDLSENLGRVVMLTGSYDAAKGISKAAVVDVASPIVTFFIKSQLGSGDDQTPAPQPGKGGKRR
jgi:hypothetical protein